MKKYYEFLQLVRNRILSDSEVSKLVNNNVFLETSWRGTKYVVPCITMGVSPPSWFVRKVPELYFVTLRLTVYHNEGVQEVSQVVVKLWDMFHDSVIQVADLHLKCEAISVTPITYENELACYSASLALGVIVTERR